MYRVIGQFYQCSGVTTLEQATKQANKLAKPKETMAIFNKGVLVRVVFEPGKYFDIGVPNATTK